jgi:molybdopterin converting factor small subunit
MKITVTTFCRLRELAGTQTWSERGMIKLYDCRLIQKFTNQNFPPERAISRHGCCGEAGICRSTNCFSRHGDEVAIFPKVSGALA